MPVIPQTELQPYAVLQSYPPVVPQVDEDDGSGLLVGEVETPASISGRVIMPKTLEPNSDNDIVVERLRMAYAGIYITAATVSAEVTNSEGEMIASGVTLSYVSGTDGTYRGTMDANDAYWLIPGDWYTTAITVTYGDYTKTFRVPRLARSDEGNG